MKRRHALIGLGMAVVAALTSSASNAENAKVRVGMSAFQDVNSLYVGIAKGFFPGIDFEIQNTDWPGANELLMGGHVDIATSSDADVVLQNSRGVATTLAFPLYYFAGGGLMFDPKAHNWRPLPEFLKANGGDVAKAITDTLQQAKGAKVGVSAGGAEYASFIEMVTIAKMKPSDFTIVDLAQEELPPALLAGSVDIMIAGIPQRLAVLRQGYADAHGPELCSEYGRALWLRLDARIRRQESRTRSEDRSRHLEDLEIHRGQSRRELPHHR